MHSYLSHGNSVTLRVSRYSKSYCSWAKKTSSYKESIRDSFYGVILYYREYFAFAYTIGDALMNFI